MSWVESFSTSTLPAVWRRSASRLALPSAASAKRSNCAATVSPSVLLTGDFKEVSPFLQPGRQRHDHLGQWQPRLPLQRAFPDHRAAPSRVAQRILRPAVDLTVAPDLLPPELAAGGRPSEQVTVMAVPE